MTDPTLTSEYQAGYLAGATWGINTGRRQIEHQLISAADRDELIARRIVALLLQHDYNQQLVQSVLALKPYPGRTSTTIDWRQLLDGAA